MHRYFYKKKSLQLGTHLLNSIENDLKFCKLKIIFQPPHKLDSLFRYKDYLKRKIRSEIVHRYSCNCKLLIMVKHTTTFFTRAADHTGISSLIGKSLKSVK